MAQKRKKEEILIDANVFVALNFPLDSCHQKAKELFDKVKNSYQLVTNNYLISETLTVLLIKTKDIQKVKTLAFRFYHQSHPFIMAQINKRLQLKTLEIFSAQKKPKLSFSDCTLIAQALHQKINTIFTFDNDLKKFPLFKKGFKFI